MRKRILLPPPEKDLDFPLMKAIDKRRTKRKWKNESLTIQQISNICWVACGETMPASGKNKNRRTVPSGCNSQIVSVYVALETGVYRYTENNNTLEPIIEKDVRPGLSRQTTLMKSAPFGLIYVADFNKRTGIIKADKGEKMFIAGSEAALMSQNVYLYCSATNLNTVLIALVDREKLKEEIGLQNTQEIIYTQIVGKPPEE